MREFLEFDFPEIESNFGTITFDYLEGECQFIISFKPIEHSNLDHFCEGSIFVNASQGNFESDKASILSLVQSAVDTGNKNGAELQNLIVTQLHKSFINVEVDDVLQPQES